MPAPFPSPEKSARSFADLGRQRELVIEAQISGCINRLWPHHAGHIGIIGREPKGTENYQLLLGGTGAGRRQSGQIYRPRFTERWRDRRDPKNRHRSLSRNNARTESGSSIPIRPLSAWHGQGGLYMVDAYPLRG